MPKALTAPWDELKAAFIKGVPLPELAKQYGVSYSALRTRAHRCKWRADAATGAAILQQSATRSMQERGEHWGGRVATLMERHLTYLESLDPSKLKLKELEMLARITDTTDKTARRTFGLDAEQPKANLQINIKSSACLGHSLQLGHVVDAEMVDAEAAGTGTAPATLLMPA